MSVRSQRHCYRSSNDFAVHRYRTDLLFIHFFFFSSRRRHTRLVSDWSSDVCSSDLASAPSLSRERGFSIASARDAMIAFPLSLLLLAASATDSLAATGQPDSVMTLPERLEERRVGKECRSRWSPYH